MPVGILRILERLCEIRRLGGDPNSLNLYQDSREGIRRNESFQASGSGNLSVRPGPLYVNQPKEVQIKTELSRRNRKSAHGQTSCLCAQHRR